MEIYASLKQIHWKKKLQLTHSPFTNDDGISLQHISTLFQQPHAVRHSSPVSVFIHSGSWKQEPPSLAPYFMGFLTPKFPRNYGWTQRVVDHRRQWLWVKSTHGTMGSGYGWSAENETTESHPPASRHQSRVSHFTNWASVLPCTSGYNGRAYFIGFW